MPKFHVSHATRDKACRVTWPKAQPKYFFSSNQVSDEQRALFPIVDEQLGLLVASVFAAPKADRGEMEPFNSVGRSCLSLKVSASVFSLHEQNDRSVNVSKSETILGTKIKNKPWALLIDNPLLLTYPSPVNASLVIPRCWFESFSTVSTRIV